MKWLLLGLMMAVPVAVNAEPNSTETNGVIIEESGILLPENVKPKLSVDLYRSLSFRDQIYNEMDLNGIENGHMFPSSSIYINIYTRIHSEDNAGFDSGYRRLYDVRNNRPMLAKTPTNMQVTQSSGRDILSIDGAVLNSASSLGGGTATGIIIGAVANLAVGLFSGSDEGEVKSEDYLTMLKERAENCGSACNITHHDVIILVQKAAPAKSKKTLYSVSARKTSNQVDYDVLTDVALTSFKFVQDKIIQVSKQNLQPDNQEDTTSSSDNSVPSDTATLQAAEHQ